MIASKDIDSLKQKVLMRHEDTCIRMPASTQRGEGCKAVRPHRNFLEIILLRSLSVERNGHGETIKVPQPHRAQRKDHKEHIATDRY